MLKKYKYLSILICVCVLVCMCSISLFFVSEKLCKENNLNNIGIDHINAAVSTVSSNANASSSELTISGNDTRYPHTAISEFTDVKYIDNSEYFIQNPWHHDNNTQTGLNVAGVCTSVALQMLMGYHNYYSDRRIIPISGNNRTFLSNDYGDMHAHPSISQNLVSGQGSQKTGTTDGFFHELYDLNPIRDFPALGQAVGIVKEAGVSFLKKYTPEEVRNNISLTSDFFSRNTARADINSGNPIIIGVQPIFTGADSFHVIPAYGYAKYDGIDGYLVHYGWGSSRTQVWIPESWCAFQIRMSVFHTHEFVDTGNDINLTHRELKCSICGLNTVKSLYKTNSLGNEIIGTNYNLSGEITIPKAINGIVLTGIGANAFAKQKERIELKKIQFEYDNQINYIGKNAFANLLIEEIVLPKNLVRIEDNSFANCRNLKHISSIDNIQNIGKFAFKDCKLLTNFMVSPKVQSIGEGAFAGCDNLNISVSKGNQPELLENVSLYFEHSSAELPCFVTKMKDHGRIEKREYRLLTDLSWLSQRQAWDGLQAVGIATATITRDGKTSTQTRYFLSSVTNVERFAYAIRSHWAIENQLHWCLDVIFDEDASKARKDMSPLNLNVLRKTALALCKNADLGKRVSIQKKRFRAALNPDTFLSILFGSF